MKLKKDNVILRTENFEEIEALKQRGFKEVKEEVKKPKEKEVFDDETIKEEVKKPKNKDY